jgi:hypothetical protein
LFGHPAGVMLCTASPRPSEGDSTLLNVSILAVGLVLLTAGAEALVRGASSISARLGIPSLIVGLTIVAFGTSAPELAVSVGAACSDQADIALGNVVGSNIFSVLFILGISALVVPLAISSQLIRVDVPLMIGASVLVIGPSAGRDSRGRRMARLLRLEFPGALDQVTKSSHEWRSIFLGDADGDRLRVSASWRRPVGASIGSVTPAA